MKTIEEHLCLNADRYPEKPAVVTPEQQLTYRELHQAVCEKAEALSDRKGQAVVFASSRPIDFLVTYLAIHRAGAIAVPLDKDAPPRRFRAIEEQLSTETFAHDTADVLYTTGTTGRPKGVVISHKAIMADAANLIAAQGYRHDTVFIVCGPLSHFGSLSKVFPTMVCGATLYLLQGMTDLNAFFRALDYPSCRLATFLVPANIRMLVLLAAKRLQRYADKLDFIETGAAPIAPDDMSRLCALLPRTRLYNTYASTETGIIATFDYNDTCIGGCVGHAMPHSRFFITDKGTIACQGATLMTRYAGDPELTRQILHDNTLFTADLGHIDEEGRLCIIGREDDIINIGGYKVAPTEVEAAALALPGIVDCICTAVPHPVTGSALKLLFVAEPSSVPDTKVIARHLATLLEAYKVPALYEQTDHIRRTFNGKLDRKAHPQPLLTPTPALPKGGRPNLRANDG